MQFILGNSTAHLDQISSLLNVEIPNQTKSLSEDGHRSPSNMMSCGWRGMIKSSKEARQTVHVKRQSTESQQDKRMSHYAGYGLHTQDVLMAIDLGDT